MGAYEERFGGQREETDDLAEIYGPAPARKGAYQQRFPDKYPPPTPMSEVGRAADMGDLATASIFDELGPRVDYLSRAMGIPKERFRLHEGRLAYQADPEPDQKQGNWYYVVPEASADPRTWAQGLATGVGPSISQVPPAAVGILTAPAHLAGPGGTAASVAATTGTGALAQTLRESIASKLGGQQISPRRIGEAAATEGLTQGMGLGLTSWAQRNAAVKARQISEAAKAASRLKETPWTGGGRPVGDLARDVDVRLTPAEQTDIPMLKVEQKMLTNLPEAADEMGAFYRSREGDIDTAVNRLLDRIHQVRGSGLTGAETTGKEGVEAAEAAIGAARRRRSVAVEPFYTEARASGAEVEVEPVLDTVDSLLGAAKGKLRRDLETAKDLLYRDEAYLDDEGVEQTRRVLDTSIDGLHNTKIALEDMLKAPKVGDTALTATGRRHITNIHRQLTDALGAAHPSYERGRALYQQMSPEVTRLENNIVGIISGLPPNQYRNVAKKLFEGAGPLDIRRARRDLKKVAPQTWKKLKRVYLEDQWLTAGKETLEGQINRGAKWRKLLVGDAAKRRNLRAALEPHEYRALLDLSDVLHAAGRVKKIGSDTKWNNEAMAYARRKARPTWAKIVATPLRPQDWGNMVDEWATERNMKKHMNKYAAVITSPDAIRELRELKKLTPGDAQWRVGIMHFLKITLSGASRGTGLGDES